MIRRRHEIIAKTRSDDGSDVDPHRNTTGADVRELAFPKRKQGALVQC